MARRDELVVDRDVFRVIEGKTASLCRATYAGARAGLLDEDEAERVDGTWRNGVCVRMTMRLDPKVSALVNERSARRCSGGKVIPARHARHSCSRAQSNRWRVWRVGAGNRAGTQTQTQTSSTGKMERQRQRQWAPRAVEARRGLSAELATARQRSWSALERAGHRGDDVVGARSRSVPSKNLELAPSLCAIGARGGVRRRSSYAIGVITHPGEPRWMRVR